ncbi:MAG: DNA translocase FtsK [Prevotella sp.]|nr:DNA translocase FtsK [Prevotella sp.]MCM1075119.1 DNA translocase FtsK [Ruminococcus sp.]
MSNYDTFSPDIEHGYSPEDNLTYDDVSTERPRRRRGDQSSNARQNGETRTRRTVKKPTMSSVPLKVKINKFLSEARTRGVLGVIMLVFGSYLAIAFISYVMNGFHDQSEIQNVAIGTAANVENIAGEGGARLSDILINQSFGLASGVIIIWALGLAFKFFGLFRFKVVNFTIKCLVALITTSLIIGLTTIALDAHFLWGGAHGYVINERIIHYVGWIGAALLCVVLVAIFFAICLYDIYKYFKGIATKRRMEREAIEEEQRKREELERKIAELQALEEEKSNSDTDEAADSISDLPANDLIFTDKEAENADDEAGINTKAEEQVDIDKALEEDEDISENLLEKLNKDDRQDSDPVRINTSSGVMTVTTNEIGKAVADDDTPDVYDPTAELSRYKFPTYSLLRESVSRISVDQNEQLENQEKIRATLADFGIEITEIKATVGPTVTLYEIRPDKGIKISKIRNLGDDIALSLAAVGVRIIAPIPGRGTVGIEVANKDPQTVSMRTIITSRAYQESKCELPLAIGSTINNSVYIADLAKMPHLLVAGATGQGKSVGLNAIIASLLYSKHPAELKFVLVDPKMVEFSLYQALEKHYLAQIPGEDEAVITHPEKVVATLSSLCVEMGARYELLKAAEVRNIKEYNTKFIERKLNPEKGHRFMPYIVVIVDEFADLIMTAGKEIETPIARLAQKARAIGIHVILATQRPSANVITGVIKANFPARIAFKVASGVDSRTVLDATGAEHLVGRGDMLISNNSEMERVQCAFIDTPEVTAICKHIQSQVGYPTPYILPEPLAVGEGSGNASGAEFGDRDPLFEEIARLIVTSNTASTSSLQRRYSIGYNRAGKIMDQMEAAGIVGPATGGKPRQVLVDSITLESILQSF